MGMIDFIFPKKCLECGREDKYICEDCIRKVDLGGPNSIWRYQGVVRKAIIAIKYKFATEIADELVGYINLPSSQNCLVPIPSHWYKQNFRGFNQAELLGEKLAKKMDWKFIPDLLIKTHSTPPQVGLKGMPRRQNLRGVFVFNPHYPPITNHWSLVLFDDVLTTGSTLKEAAKVLKEAGVKKLWCLTIAR